MRFFLLSLLLVACVESAEPPAPITQATVRYGSGSGPARLYLEDPDSLRHCRALVSSSTIATDATGCFLPVRPGTLAVDQVEATNLLYQFCVDSGVCKTPNPADANKPQLCSREEDWDRCPIVGVPVTDAIRFCDWMGRRLPTSMELLISRQVVAAAPESVAPFPNGAATAPAACAQAIYDGCQDDPAPHRLVGGELQGATEADVVNAETGKVYNVVGNVAEWVSDRFPASRNLARALPWFCVAPLNPLDPDGNEWTQANPPTCPTNAFCAWGNYRPGTSTSSTTGLPAGLYPVCVAQLASSSGPTSPSYGGTVGAAIGASHSTEAALAGTYARRLVQKPEEVVDTVEGRQIGIRCVGKRADAGGGALGDFTDKIELAPFTP